MKLKDISRLPVIDNKGNLIGIISKGDIFRALVNVKMRGFK
jgi:CBS domain-containing protein